ncbi:MAG: DEAD/DEAH box helicase [Candidatus Micrarchaeia archaeon]
MKFEEMKLSYEILHALDKMGFENATEIQEKAIPLALQGEDLIGQAKTGTGKTAAFGICILEEIKHRGEGQKGFPPRRPTALVLAPTRELAMQIKEELSKLGSTMKAPILAVYGGVGIEPQISALRRGVAILIGTPGRLLDLMERRELDLSATSIVVLDEADRMLDMGFIYDIESILSETQQNRQTLLFSATMPAEILQISKKYMKNPIHLNISQDELVVEKIEQYYLEVTMHNRVSTLLALLQAENPKLALVFTRTKAGADRLSHLIKANGFNAQALHGDMSQNKRDRAMDAFKHGHVQVLVATDLASRGLDVREITHVINYDMPMDAETYVHRIGRTGRMEANGRAFTLVFPDQTRELMHYQAKTGARIIKTDVDSSQVRVNQPHRLGHSRDERGGGYGRGDSRGGSRFGGRREGGRSGGYGSSGRSSEGRRFGGSGRPPRRDFGGQGGYFAKRDSFASGDNSRDASKRHGKRTEYVGRQD